MPRPRTRQRPVEDHGDPVALMLTLVLAFLAFLLLAANR